jgi:hypothetical protein
LLSGASNNKIELSPFSDEAQKSKGVQPGLLDADIAEVAELANKSTKATNAALSRKPPPSCHQALYAPQNQH